MFQLDSITDAKDVAADGHIFGGDAWLSRPTMGAVVKMSTPYTLASGKRSTAPRKNMW